MTKRENAVLFRGTPLHLIGPELKPGMAAPDYRCVTSALAVVGLADTPAKPRLFSVVPSLDTPVCSLQTKTFEDALAQLGDRVAAYTVSLDLPFAQKRFCTAERVVSMQTMSDAHDGSFGQAWGVLLEGLPLPLLARAVFVVDATGQLTHCEYVHEVSGHPDYDRAVAELRKLVEV